MRYLTDEELNIATRFLFLSMAIVVIQQDIGSIQKGPFKIKEPYIQLLEKMNSNALTERRQLRSTMEKKKLKVMLLNKNDSFSSYLFICKGKEEKRNYFNPAIRKKVQEIVQEIMWKSLSPEQSLVAANA
ncbi:hypothetical protein [Ornithinibacillus bavariensis]|uniref:Uncharacterized protein n=1 Tax=Ornithinibacillus bavariensis TaxID=545502 RepID=A0A919X7U0_9BACI|nr:hypothetical protein [Ornithinibacillus bavariensis]GIO25713.1 hypothetical protein J43TS3_03240 [Ornithinibacillus bavariensis]HAM79881.1 hypothetical protein [Ornithinibacillus sp.]